ncbi:response regulator transcription factor [Aliikangiella sp. G2MR2-5]|uniref:response regulator transcription factor n=1 Tax=Aliikangiella sp. G2MR2-5 TaxID=2788943 RepID=UPI001FEFC53C|nr:LuxR C-terminal-related transcriptional regulator [Aliikangiella sp. G2MR2-5]
MTPEEQRRLNYVQTKILWGLVGLLAAILLLTGVIIIAIEAPQTYPQDQHFVIIPLLVFWIYLLRHYPRQLWHLKNDLKNKNVEQVRGIGILHNKPGFRILFSPPQQVSVSGITMDLQGFPVEKLLIGQRIKVRYLPQSLTLLSAKVDELAVSDADTHDQSSHSPPMELSELEVSIIQLMAEGLSDKLIARQLNLEPATVRTYNSTIYRKLAVKNRKQASEKARQLGLVDVN